MEKYVSVSKEDRDELKRWVDNAKHDELTDNQKHLYDMLTMNRSSGYGKLKPPSYVISVMCGIIIIVTSYMYWFN